MNGGDAWGVDASFDLAYLLGVEHAGVGQLGLGDLLVQSAFSQACTEQQLYGGGVHGFLLVLGPDDQTCSVALAYWLHLVRVCDSGWPDQKVSVGNQGIGEVLVGKV